MRFQIGIIQSYIKTVCFYILFSLSAWIYLCERNLVDPCCIPPELRNKYRIKVATEMANQCFNMVMDGISIRIKAVEILGMFYIIYEYLPKKTTKFILTNRIIIFGTVVQNLWSNSRLLQVCGKINHIRQFSIRP